MLISRSSSLQYECPGDTISYNCSVQSNSENLQLTWRVTLPGMMPVNRTYDGTSSRNTADNLGVNIITTLITYYSEEYIESTITLTLLMDFVTNGTILECISEDLDSDSVSVDVMQSGTNTDHAFILSNCTL